MQLVERLKEAVRTERAGLVGFLRLLIEAEKTEVYREESYSSLHDFCMEGLGLSRSSSLRRINAARLAIRFSAVLPLIESGALHLSALALLSPHLTAENHAELFEEAKGKSERELERSLAARSPQTKKIKNALEWLSANEAKLTVVLPADVVALLERVRELRKHVHPDGNATELLRDALSAYLKRIDPLKKKAPVSRAPKNSIVHPRRTRRRVQHEVWHRDEGQCTYTSSSGRRCTQKGGLEIDHRQPWADGGSSQDPSNLRLLCTSHNRYLARRRFGDKVPRRG